MLLSSANTSKVVGGDRLSPEHMRISVPSLSLSLCTVCHFLASIIHVFRAFLRSKSPELLLLLLGGPTCMILAPVASLPKLAQLPLYLMQHFTVNGRA